MARGLGFAEQVRRDILRKRRKVRTGHGRIAPVSRPVRDKHKTLAMYLLEQQHGESIEELIGTGEIKVIGDALGLHKSTVSVWRKRLGLR